MSPFHDDPRLTTYALGELNAADRAAVEQQLGNSVETLLEIEAVREVAGQLRAALQNEAAMPGQPSVGENLKSQISNLKFQDVPTAAPVVISTAKDAAPRRKFSGRFAVAASCLALLGTFGLVGLSGRNEQYKTTNFAETSNRIEWYDFIAEGDGTSSTYGPLTAMSIVDGEVFGEVELKRHLARETIAVDPTTAARDRFDFESAGGGLAANSTLSGLGGFDVTAIGSGPAVKRPGGISVGAGGVGGRGGAGEGFRSRGSGSRQAMLGGGGGTAPNPIVRNRMLIVGETPALKRRDQPNEKPRSHSYALDDSRQQGQGLASTPRFGIERSVELNLKLREEQAAECSAESYAAIHDNPFASPLPKPLSTFSIDVDTAAYSNMRRFLTQGSWPPPDAVRIEEMVNYFTYDYTPPGAEISNLKSEISNLKSQTPTDNVPFAVHLEVAACPWNAEHRLVRVGLKGKEIALDKRPVSNIVFLIDVSGSMQPANRLPLVKAGLRRLVDQLNENDRVGIVVYAGASGLVLDSTNATQKDVILSAIENLQAGGSTNGGEGIQLAYALARKHFINKGTNRVILCTDGDFNVGITNQDDLTRLIEEESKSGVFLSVLGFGMGNLKDSTLEKLADKGNGNYAYIDTLKEANKVFVEQMTGTLITIAKDVKIQIEFNPSQVGAYRLIGYENRLLAAQDFRDDTKDAGEIGAGHTVTALYEVIPPSKLPTTETPAATSLKYQPNVSSPAGAPATDAATLRKYGPRTGIAHAPLVAGNAKNELLTIWLRYKQPDADKSDAEIEQVLVDEGHPFAKASIDFRWAASVASFGMILRNSPHKGNATLDSVLELAQSAIGPDKSGYREEFVSLVRSAKALQPHPTK